MVSLFLGHLQFNRIHGRDACDGCSVRDLLLSCVYDLDLAYDWVYYSEVQDQLSGRLLRVQLAFCIIGTFWWFLTVVVTAGGEFPIESTKLNQVVCAFLFLGIFLEDIPQLIITNNIESKLNRWLCPEQTLSGSAIINIMTSSYDLAIKLTETIEGWPAEPEHNEEAEGERAPVEDVEKANKLTETIEGLEAINEIEPEHNEEAAGEQAPVEDVEKE